MVLFHFGFGFRISICLRFGALALKGSLRGIHKTEIRNQKSEILPRISTQQRIDFGRRRADVASARQRRSAAVLRQTSVDQSRTPREALHQPCQSNEPPGNNDASNDQQHSLHENHLHTSRPAHRAPPNPERSAALCDAVCGDDINPRRIQRAMPPKRPSKTN